MTGVKPIHYGKDVCTYQWALNPFVKEFFDTVPKIG